MPYPSLGILNVSFVAGDDMNMDMKNALPGRGSDIDADIVAIRIELIVDEGFFLFDEVHTGRHFFRRQVEKAGYMPTRNDQGVSRTRRVGVAGTECKFMAQRYPTRIFAKQARVIGVPFLFLFGFRRQQNTPGSIYTSHYDTESC